MLKSVNDMYIIDSQHNKKLLSEYNADFWNEYKTNYQHYDKLFNRFYRSFKYFMQDGTEDLATLTNDFTDDVYNHLLVNHKKYSELYRVHVIADADYSLTDNYNITEIMDKDGTDNNNNVYGSRSDTNNNSIGEQTTTNNVGQQSTTNTFGERLDSSTSNIGQQANNSTNKVAPYDSENFYNNEKNDINIGSRSDSTSAVKGSEIDSINTGARTDSTVAGSRNDSNTFNKGQETDNLNKTYSEDYTLTRKGNIGIQTVTDMINKHEKFWTVYEFYTMIFREIARELLLV